jgi:hypothetical protein
MYFKEIEIPLKLDETQKIIDTILSVITNLPDILIKKIIANYMLPRNIIFMDSGFLLNNTSNLDHISYTEFLNRQGGLGHGILLKDTLSEQHTSYKHLYMTNFDGENTNFQSQESNNKNNIIFSYEEKFPNNSHLSLILHSRNNVKYIQINNRLLLAVIIKFKTKNDNNDNDNDWIAYYHPSTYNLHIITKYSKLECGSMNLSYHYNIINIKKNEKKIILHNNSINLNISTPIDMNKLFFNDGYLYKYEYLKIKNDDFEEPPSVSSILSLSVYDVITNTWKQFASILKSISFDLDKFNSDNRLLSFNNNDDFEVISLNSNRILIFNPHVCTDNNFCIYNIDQFQLSPIKNFDNFRLLKININKTINCTFQKIEDYIFHENQNRLYILVKYKMNMSDTWIWTTTDQGLQYQHKHPSFINKTYFIDLPLEKTFWTECESGFEWIPNKYHIQNSEKFISNVLCFS